MATAGGQIEVGTVRRYLHLTTTVVGLVVGIIAYVGYNHLVVKTDKIVHTWKPMQLTFRLIKRPHNYEFKRKK
jgi:biopolymer transport protein ExbB